jgi:endonuclease YncB( thermonuclease family)
MSHHLRFDSFNLFRRKRALALRAWIGFGLGLAGGAALALSVWQHNWGAPVVIHNAASDNVDSLRQSPALPQTGRYAVDVLRVLDGDTFEARVHVWPGVDLTTRVRLRSIDAPELKARCERELVRAEAAREALRQILDERDVSIWSIGPDKYFGRIVAEVSTRRTPDVSAALLGKGVVRRYAGGHRDGWCGTRASGA